MATFLPAQDLPGSRRSVRTVATKGHIYAMLTLALMSGGLFLAALFGGGAKAADAAAHALPDSVVLMCVGMVGFALFFPWFLALYYARHLLISVEQVEADLARLRERAAAFDGTALPGEESGSPFS